MNQLPKISDLSKNNIVVHVEHRRMFYKFDSRTGEKDTIRLSWKEKKATHNDYHLSLFGGDTKVVVSTPDCKTPFTGWSECADSDRFNRKRGIGIALSRALYYIFLEDNQITKSIQSQSNENTKTKNKRHKTNPR